MRRALISCALFVACGGQPAQRIVLDDAHNAMSPETAKHVPSYAVHAADVYVLDATHYTLRSPEKMPLPVHDANFVSVASPSGMYALTWPPHATQLTIAKSNATPMGTSPPFAGFKAGEQVIVMIGYSEPGSSASKLSLVPFWVGQVDVRQ